MCSLLNIFPKTFLVKPFISPCLKPFRLPFPVYIALYSYFLCTLPCFTSSFYIALRVVNRFWKRSLNNRFCFVFNRFQKRITFVLENDRFLPYSCWGGVNLTSPCSFFYITHNIIHNFSYIPKALPLGLKPGFNTNCLSPQAHCLNDYFSCNKINLCFDPLSFW